MLGSRHPGPRFYAGSCKITEDTIEKSADFASPLRPLIHEISRYNHLLLVGSVSVVAGCNASKELAASAPWNFTGKIAFLF
jgi:hypothetical protein